MGRAGRKRKGWRREPNGRAQRKSKSELHDERVHIARNQPHRQGLKSNDKISELAESPLGRLNLKGAISRGQRAAGETFARIVISYRGVIEGPRPVRSLMPETTPEREKTQEELEELAGRFDCPAQYADPIERRITIGGQPLTVREWPCEQSPDGCLCRQRRDRYMRAYEAIAEAGRTALMAVIRVAVRGEDIAGEDLVYLRRGLSAAQKHLGLTDIDRDA